MSRALKWIFGIVIGLLVVAALVGAGIWFFNRWDNGNWMIGARAYRLQPYGRGMPWRYAPGQGTPLNPGPQVQRPLRPLLGIPVGRFSGLHPLGMFFVCLIGIGFLVLVVLGVVYLISPRRPAAQAVGIAPATVSPAPEPARTPAHACPHCGRPVQDDWSHCPYCGGPLTGQAEITPPPA